MNIVVEKPLLDSKVYPRYLLTNAPTLLFKLLGIVSSPSIEVLTEAWDYIISLPENENLVKRFATLEFDPSLGTSENWESILNVKSGIHALIAYSLHLFLEVLSGKSLRQEQLAEHKEKLKGKNCLQFIFKLLGTFTKCKYSATSIKCVNYCLKIMLVMWDNAVMAGILSSRKEQEAFWQVLTDLIKFVLTSPQEISRADIPEVLETCTKMIIANQDIFYELILSDFFLKLLQPGKLIVNA